MIRLSKSVVGTEEVEAITKVLLQDGYLGMGKEVDLFEEEIANYLGVKRSSVVCVSSGTAALHLAVQAVARQGDEVLVPSFTFISSFQAISASGATPVACNIYKDSLTIDIEHAESRITNRTKAIMPVHYASNPVNLEKIYRLAAKYKLRVIEDAAHCFGCSYQSSKIGSFGDIICFSFDGIKNITSGEGGAIITSDEKIQSLVKDARLLGIMSDTEKRFSGKRSWDFEVVDQGYRYHMSNIFAAIGREQLKKLDTVFAPTRIKLATIYKELLCKNSSIAIPVTEKKAYIVPHIFPIRILNGKRDEIKQYLEANGVQTGIHYKPNHLLSLYSDKKTKLDVTEEIYKEILTLPLHPDLKEEDIYYVSELINRYLGYTD
ncbi:dTDP-4-amino-4,6-dideoxygalactose transaminase [Hydrobacter penzbergensis]|uniref:dTDP-4-amino-4,6-dideoxygalactose transaminase n=1 Tax=Hydrobacter penzbergensis TaxID=1235997 RepID=A0A8X8IFX8_9BACT|nr:DegT/DnrJ/EryC1/StrS family aminotransferase [Hydrobacter penzbergensis]SDW85612.1 dTDP-4-amino-4,6-dideoxygalactose transaminase [Hydrobacter penzbergensis]